jgi:hypothetical protein
MKVTELRQIISEEVRSTIRAELKDLLIEAVRIASNPETTKAQPVVQMQTPQGVSKQGNIRPLEELLEETKLSFTADDARSFVNQGMRQEMVQSFTGNNITSAIASKLGMTDPAQGVDLTNLPFLKNAKKILDVSIQKDRERQGL